MSYVCVLPLLGYPARFVILQNFDGSELDPTFFYPGGPVGGKKVEATDRGGGKKVGKLRIEERD